MRVTALPRRKRSRVVVAAVALTAAAGLIAPTALVSTPAYAADATTGATAGNEATAAATGVAGASGELGASAAGALGALGRAAQANGIDLSQLSPEERAQAQYRSAIFMPQPLPGAERHPFRTTHQDLPGLPAGVSVEKVDWYTDRHAVLHINSAAMPEKPIQVELLLPRDWYRDPDRKFDSVFHLDGMRAYDDYSGWMRATNIARFYEDKNVLVVMPAGGEASFYSDWNEPDNGKHYMWETFLLDELIPVLDRGWRASDQRGIFGISMGATSAMNVAAHSPELWQFVGSLSGYLDMTSPGMPEAMALSMRNAGGYDATKMWGPLGSQRWKDNDPKLNAEKYQGMSLYISAGNGNTGEWDRPSALDPSIPDNPTGYALEVLSRLTSETFLQRAAELNLDTTVKFREAGTHTWPYWQFEVSQAWPTLANALQLPEEDRGAICEVGGAIEQAVASLAGIGTCLSNEYEGANGGRIQDFTGGRAYWHPDTGAHVVWGRIGSRYAEMGGPASPLGYPVTNEMATPDGVGRFNHFEHGSIYWTPETGAQVVLGDMMNAWGASGWELGPLGYPVESRREVPGGVAQNFQHGTLLKLDDGEARIVRGAIGDKYRELGAENSDLGLPTSNEIPLRGGAFQSFEHGNIYWSEETGAQPTPYGDIFDHWGSTGWENGDFGYPVGPLQPVRAGGLEQQFQGGWIRQLNGKIVEERN